ncbi:nucleotide sugar dehydrogenase [Mariprofundus sp. NF]|uniref:nucleotide sugar dehydrogenase n=1 Tax=Mariprofundus sp. NF TaxID=2608716 RepID=UPI0015A49E51|nr:nucleotide sugar dehydrogenase [Mariprofundus sp. NF]NWF39504.1 nucleotide sugar dehydrogenase [Mariprofundus sp. NF]
MIKKTVAVVGLGYVGLPLALAFGRCLPTIGFDISKQKVKAYQEGYDPTGEMSNELFGRAAMLNYSTDAADITQADYVVVAVPTPVDEGHKPDLTPVIRATETVGRNLKKGAIVIFESTVYPGVTEEVCVPILEKESGLKCGDNGFKVGYSPERVNPGDKVHTLESIVKVVSGQDDETLEQVAKLYEMVVEAGVHRAATIKVAEAAKVIENTQRDLNIALINELAIIFDKMGIDTIDVLEAAGSKWNFLPFRPGLVGGHCIGVDPYYLTHKAEVLGYHPQVILAGRHINDGMSAYIAQQTVKQMIQSGACIKDSKVIVLGLTFKEDCPDLRNSKVADVVSELEEYGCVVSTHDPLAATDEAEHEYGISLTAWRDLPDAADAVVLAVGHKQYMNMPLSELLTSLRQGGVVIDVKSALDRDAVTDAGYSLWRL